MVRIAFDNNRAHTQRHNIARRSDVIFSTFINIPPYIFDRCYLLVYITFLIGKLNLNIQTEKKQSLICCATPPIKHFFTAPNNMKIFSPVTPLPTQHQVNTLQRDYGQSNIFRLIVINYHKHNTHTQFYRRVFIVVWQ